MNGSKLKIDIRRDRIMELLKRDGKVLVSQLSRDLCATPVTIRSDLAALEKRGMLMRMQGGAVLPSQPVYEEPSAAVANSNEKQAIARVAAGIVQNGDTLFINSGTTSATVAEVLGLHQNLNIVTNSLQVTRVLGRIPSSRVLLLGGEFNGQYGFTAGEDAQEQLRRYQADWAILSVDGISTQGGITTYHMEEAVIDRMMISRAKRSIIVADHTKLERPGFTRICGLDDRMILITDSFAAEDRLDELRATGLTIHIGHISVTGIEQHDAGRPAKPSL